MPIIDSIFQKGSTHQVCQDYALHGSNFAIGSDGCSSSPNTDVGARILCHTLANKIGKPSGDSSELIRYTAYDSAIIAAKLGLQEESLDATLFGFQVIDNSVISFISGDGYVYKKFRDGGEVFEELHTITFEPNMPFYPNYYTNMGRLKTFKQSGVKVGIDIDYLRSDYPSVSHNRWEADSFARYEVDLLDGLELLLMFSDGLGTFQLESETEFKKEKKDVPIVEVVRELTNFKSYSPGFVQRKVVNGLKKSFIGNLTHWDDFSVIGFANI